jgi:hypothetical protein
MDTGGPAMLLFELHPTVNEQILPFQNNESL